MIFTPCVDGISHNELEDIKQDWSTAGANVLMHAVLEKAEIVAGRFKETRMTTLIKGGTIVAADRSYVADVLIEGETIKAIGTGLSGDKTIDATDCSDHARRHRSAHPSRHAVHGHEFRRQLRHRHQGRAFRRHDDGGRFLHPRAAASR